MVDISNIPSKNLTDDYEFNDICLHVIDAHYNCYSSRQQSINMLSMSFLINLNQLSCTHDNMAHILLIQHMQQKNQQHLR